MRIAFISYEYPTETGGGGIGTYLELAASLLGSAGHDVVVFAGTKNEKAFWEQKTVLRIPARNWSDFNELLPEYFLPIHNEKPFDVAECTDFNGCGLFVKKAAPELPIVVKLHTPLYLIDKLQQRPLSFLAKARFRIGGVRRLKWPKFPSDPQPQDYRNEFELIEMAERVCSPSRSIQMQMSDMGFDVRDKSDIVPYPFVVNERVSQIQSRTSLGIDPQIVFIGRMEIRKGVIDLVDSIPAVLQRYPNAVFTFVGGAAASPVAGVNMIDYLRARARPFQNNVQFVGRVPHAKIIKYLNQGDIFVYPSHYESFGIVCCEAMAAGKAVIGSKNGGMSEMIEDNRSGVLVEPGNPLAIAAAIIDLIADDAKRVQLGTTARERIKNMLDPDLVISKQLESYEKAMKACRNKSISISN